MVESNTPKSGGAGQGPDETVLAAMVALHHRNVLSAAELAQLVGPKAVEPSVLGHLIQAGWVQARN